ncbi:MAG: YdcF family protein [Termitinemataceae bacterium]
MGTIVFYISKILRPIFTSPLCIGLIIAFWALVVLQAQTELQRRLKTLALAVLSLITLASLPIVTRIVSQAYEIPLSELDETLAAGPYQGILVLGGTVDPVASRPGFAEGNDSFERLSAAATLYKHGAAPLIIASGGTGSLTYPDRKEAPLMGELLELMGVPTQAILLESQSRNTFENILYTKELLQSRGNPPGSRILLVSSAWHLRRALAICNKVGLDVHPFSVDSQAEPLLLPADLFPDAWALYRSTRLLREWVGILAYRLLGRL